MHAPVEWRLYDTCGVHHVMFKDLEIFMLVEKNYPLKKALALVMICYKLQVENYSQMATDLVRKIQQIAGIPTASYRVPTARRTSHCQKRKMPLLEEKRSHCQEDRTAINTKEKQPVKDGSYTKSPKTQFRSVFSISQGFSFYHSLRLLRVVHTHQEIDQKYPTIAKIPISDTGKFEQWQFRIQQYLQHEHYVLWEVIEFGDSYEVPTNTTKTTDTTTTTTTSGETRTKSGRTVTLTAEDMQKKKNDVKARNTLLLSLPDEHQLRFSKYKTTRELWAAILKTFGGNEAPRRRRRIFSSSSMETLERKDQKLWSRRLADCKSQDKERRDNFRQGSKAEEQDPKALMAIDKVGWDWSYMANDGEDHALVADEEAPIE
nr:hypothetical protein [Tanacetum cinerariifolium]